MKYICLLMFIVSCRPSEECAHKSIIIENNSDKTLYVVERRNTRYPIDSSANNFFVDPKSAGYITYHDSEYFRIKPHDINSKAISSFLAKTCLSSYFHDPNYGTQIFLFDSSTIYLLSWDTVKKKNLFLKRVIHYGHELDSVGWKISYP